MFLDAIMCKEHTGSSRQSTRAEMQCKPWRFLAPLQVYPSINYRSGAEKSERNGIQCTVQYFGRDWPQVMSWYDVEKQETR
jgi:hypothetical protein